eukprot:TRINITY_DN4140_c0_g1_i1.p1 TRINITY_DN4140_c0_g1~~TRINITY_DN4140_c0_g1_i1.p1  ORF type:complete len:340 (+),score=190.66 TRINITY_DN4140_c0_g1_i1:107-1021(+)
MPKRRPVLQMNASEKSDGYGRRYTIKPSKYEGDDDEDDVLNEEEDDGTGISFGGDEDEEEESVSVASKRSKAVQQQVAESTSARQKRKTQFPNRFSVFAMTSMRQSVMIKKDKTLKKKIKEEPIPEPEPEPEPMPDPKKKKKIIVVRQLKGLLGTLEDWTSKSTADVLGLLGLGKEDADDYDLVFANDDDLDSDAKRRLDSYTVKKNGTSIAVMEECSSDNFGNSSFLNIGGKIGLLGRFFKGDQELAPPGGRMLDKNEKKRREEAMKKVTKYEVKKEKKKKKKYDSDSEDEDRPPVYDPYYHP